MPAPKGNKFALNSGKGRPRDFDRKVEAEALLEWAKTPEALVMRMFAPLRGYSFDSMTRWAEEDEDFRQAYIMAKDLVGARRELVLIEKGCPSPFQRYAGWYDRHLAEFEYQVKERESKLKQEEIKTASEYRVNYGSDQQVPSKALPASCSSSSSERD